jgi:hypothetical protein
MTIIEIILAFFVEHRIFPYSTDFQSVAIPFFKLFSSKPIEVLFSFAGFLQY